MGSAVKKEEFSDALRLRVRRMRGQLDGIERMIVEERPLADVRVQLSALKGALGALETELLFNALCAEVEGTGTARAEAEQLTARLLDVLQFKKRA